MRLLELTREDSGILNINNKNYFRINNIFYYYYNRNQE